MGLDFYIDVVVYDKKMGSATDGCRYELAYWHKHYSLRDRLMALAEDYWLEDYKKNESNDDYIRTCSPNAINEVINVLLDNLKNEDSNLWTNTVFLDKHCVRLCTLQRLPVMIAFQQYYLSRYSTEELQDNSEFETDIEALNIKEDEDLLHKESKNPVLYEILDMARTFPDDYEVVLQFINSY